MSVVYLKRFRFSERDIYSFVVPTSSLEVDSEIRLPETKLCDDYPKIGVILAEEKGYDGYVIDEPYIEALQSHNVNLCFLTYDNISSQIKNLELDGLLLIGGNFDSPAEYYLHPEELPDTHRLSKRSVAYLDAIACAQEYKLPLLGICAGFQMLAGYFGAKMYANVIRELGSHLPHKFDKYQDAHAVSVVDNTKLATICGNKPEIMVNSVHSEGVSELSEGLDLVVSARSSDGNVEAVEIRGDWFALGVQWHPEYLWRRSPEANSLFSSLVDAAHKYQTGE